VKPIVRSLFKLGAMFVAALLLAVAAGRSFALESRLTEFIGQVAAADLVPGADRYGPSQGSPPLAKLYAGDRVVGYAFVNADWVNSTGYSGQPIQILVGLTTDGKIGGASNARAMQRPPITRKRPIRPHRSSISM
jgi:NosR/NirI family nitrous oxide reductase transcriptional regulator